MDELIETATIEKLRAAFHELKLQRDQSLNAMSAYQSEFIVTRMFESFDNQLIQVLSGEINLGD